MESRVSSGSQERHERNFSTLHLSHPPPSLDEANTEQQAIRTDVENHVRHGTNPKSQHSCEMRYIYSKYENLIKCSFGSQLPETCGMPTASPAEKCVPVTEEILSSSSSTEDHSSVSLDSSNMTAQLGKVVARKEEQKARIKTRKRRNNEEKKKTHHPSGKVAITYSGPANR